MDYDEEGFIEWIEPFDPEAKYNLICRMKIKEVIDWQINREDIKAKGFIYESREQALVDFMTTHWADLV